MTQAILRQTGDSLDYTPVAAQTGGDVLQIGDGRAAVFPQDVAAADLGAASVKGVFRLLKTANINLLDGQRVYWDHSANTATYKTANDRDFYLGLAVGDSLAAATTVDVAINEVPRFLTRLQDGGWTSLIVKTVVGSTTVEVPDVKMRGGSAEFIFGATAEAQKVDLLSNKAFALGSNWIVEGEVNVIDDGDAAAIDFNIGVANATHASDADAITESVFLHLDGNSLDLYAESDDGTTEVAATDTTVNIALATPFHFVIDGRNPADVQIYVNGVLMLTSTVFDISVATGPLKLLAHLEKTSDDTTASYIINELCVRTMEQ